MIDLRLLLKVLYKPREVFEQLKFNVNAKDGVFLWGLLTLLATFIFMGAVRRSGMDLVPLSFGISYFEGYLLVGEFVKAFFLFLLIAWLANFFARHFGGEGNASEMIGMFGYSRIVALPIALVSVLFLSYFNSLAVSFLVQSVEGGAVSLNFGALMVIFMAFGIVFWIWNLWIQVTAVLVEHRLSAIKAIAALMLSYLLVTGLLLGFNLVTGMSLALA